MWNCASCGAEVDDNYAACWSCGTHADGVPAPHLVREDARLHCYVCDALGEFADVDGVTVCPDCVRNAPPAPAAGLRKRIFLGVGIIAGLAAVVVGGLYVSGDRLPWYLNNDGVVLMLFYACIFCLGIAFQSPGAARWQAARRARKRSKNLRAW
jgi:hypothetical protein